MEISKKRLRKLERAEYKLNCLESGGVDNWSNYDDALKDYYSKIKKEELADEVIENILEILAEGASGEVMPDDSFSVYYSDSVIEDAQEYIIKLLV